MSREPVVGGLMDNVMRSFIGMLIIVLGFILLSLGILFHFMTRVRGLQVNETIVIIPPFVIISGGLSTTILILIILLVLLIPIITLIILLKHLKTA